MKKFIPVTPGGTACDWLESNSEKEAWDKLMEDASHMPYSSKEEFEERGYSVEEVIEDEEVWHDVDLSNSALEESAEISEDAFNSLKTEFKREQRYVVFKISDIDKYLNQERKDQFSLMANEIATKRQIDGRDLLASVVVEADWPEYEKVWKMIEDRVSGKETGWADANVAMPVKEGYYYCIIENEKTGNRYPQELYFENCRFDYPTDVFDQKFAGEFEEGDVVTHWINNIEEILPCPS